MTISAKGELEKQPTKEIIHDFSRTTGHFHSYLRTHLHWWSIPTRYLVDSILGDFVQCFILLFLLQSYTMFLTRWVWCGRQVGEPLHVHQSECERVRWCLKMVITPVSLAVVVVGVSVLPEFRDTFILPWDLPIQRRYCRRVEFFLA